jgi:NAD(P)-dependent dehydrogenase (short-subunit alcohol dehydrogenase family)
VLSDSKEGDAMNPLFEGKVALVTGAGSGIGRATAQAFAREGARVVVADVNVAGLNETVRLIQEAGGQAYGVQADVSQPAQVQQMVDTALAEFGRLDAAVNNAGIEGEQAALAEASAENWDRVIGINLRGAWSCMKAEIPAMLRSGGGAIVNMSSVAGLVGFANISPYVASKHGMVGLTRTAALEYAKQGIRVNAVCPGAIDTPMIDRFTRGDASARAAMDAMHPMGRMGRPEEIAEVAIWLCSDRASFVTGHALPVDGGMTAA